LKSGLINTIAYYSKTNKLSITHERNRWGHGDLADAVVTAIFLVSKKADRPKKTCNIVHYNGPGTLWIEEMPKIKKVIDIEVERY